MVTPFRSPSACIPIALSLAGLLLVVGHALVFGVVREVDEGAAAHVFQILMAAQIPFVIWHLATRLPRVPRQALGVFAVQAAAAFVTMAATWLLT